MTIPILTTEQLVLFVLFVAFGYTAIVLAILIGLKWNRRRIAEKRKR